MSASTNPIHLAFIEMIALIFLGPKRLTELARSLGTGTRELRDTLSLDHAEPTAISAPGAAPAPFATASLTATGTAAGKLLGELE